MRSDHQERVIAMMQAFGQATPVVASPKALEKVARLRWRLIDEEATEVCEALEEFETEPSKEAFWHVVKELCDLSVVLQGTLAAMGVPDEAAFRIVDVNNILKAGYPKDEHGKVIKAEDHPKVDFLNPSDLQNQYALGILEKHGVRIPVSMTE